MLIKFRNKIQAALLNKDFSEIFKGSLLTFISRVLAVFCGLASNLIIAKYYGAELLGIVALITSLLKVSGVFTSIGLNTALLRLIPEQLSKNSLSEARVLFFKSVKIVILVGSIVSLFIWFFTPEIVEGIYKDDSLTQWFSIAAILITALSISSLNLSGIRALKKVKLFAAMQVVQPVLNLLLLILLTLWFFEQNNPVYIYFISICSSFIISSFVIIKCFNLGNGNLNEEHDLKLSYFSLIKLSWPMCLTSAMWVLMSQIDMIMIGSLLTKESVGVYAVVMKLGMFVNFVLASINTVLAPKFSELFYQNRMESLVKIAKKSSKLIFITTSPLIFILIMFGESILSFFGDEFLIGYTALIFIALGQFVNSVCGSVGYFMNMTGRQNTFNRIVLCGLLCNILFNALLIPEYGINGAAVASFMSACLWNIVTLFYIKKKFGFYMGYLPLYKKKL